jgi:hypothetical protein
MSTRVVCRMCGREIDSTASVAELLDGSQSFFDSKDCLLIFKKLRVLYGKGFFA